MLHPSCSCFLRYILLIPLHIHFAYHVHLPSLLIVAGRRERRERRRWETEESLREDCERQEGRSGQGSAKRQEEKEEENQRYERPKTSSGDQNFKLLPYFCGACFHFGTLCRRELKQLSHSFPAYLPFRKMRFSCFMCCNMYYISWETSR